MKNERSAFFTAKIIHKSSHHFTPRHTVNKKCTATPFRQHLRELLNDFQIKTSYGLLRCIIRFNSLWYSYSETTTKAFSSQHPNLNWICKMQG